MKSPYQTILIMPRILITGNGFDLHHNLPTWYEDFMKIIKFVSDNKETDFDSLYQNAKNYEGIKSAFTNTISISPQKFDEIREITGKNLLYQYFENEYNIDTWIDFESKLEYLLNCVYNSVKLLRRNIFSTGTLQHNARISIKEKLDGKVEYASILKVLNVAETDFQSLFIKSNFLIIKDNFNVNIDEQKILDLIFSQLMEFKKLFHIYLETFVTPLLDQRNDSMKHVEFYKFFSYHFTFNYTATASKIYGEKTKLFYLHGKSEEKNENIVFGINELFNKEENADDYLRFTKYYQKYAYRTDYHFLNDIVYSKSSDFQFFFWGHSLDKSDGYYVNEIFDYLKGGKNLKNLIVVIYHNEESYKRLLRNLFFIRGRADIENRMQERSLIFCELNSPEFNRLLEVRLTSPMKDPSVY